MAKQISVRPIRKVTAGAVAGAASTVFLWVLSSVWRIEVPGNVANAITVLLTFVVSYQTPSADDDLIPKPTSYQRAA